MDFLKADILRRKKELEDGKLVTEDKKYFKRSELRQKLDEEYWAKSKRPKLTTDTDSNGSKSPHTVEEVIPSKKDKSEQDKERILPRNEVIRRLRDHKQPIRLYGESDHDSYQRLKRVEASEEPDAKGMRNDFITALDKVEETDVAEMFSRGGEGSTSLEVAIKADYIEPEELESLRKRLVDYTEGNITAANEEEEAAIFGEISETVLRYLKYILSTWGRELNARSKEEKQLFTGKMASATYTQTLTYIIPLFRKLKLKKMPPDILDSLVKITALCMDRNYIKANDRYLELAIGNSPWPLGVTNHGIHSRTAQEKIHAKNVAHVLNDETQRKFIQAIKRLMTNCQRLFPTDPSRSVNYMGP